MKRFISLFMSLLMLMSTITCVDFLTCADTGATASIPETAVRFNDNYYQVYDNCNSWEEARQYCEYLGGHLATITSKEENDFLYQVLANSGYKNAYFGFTDRDNEGTWTWVTGENVEYTNWHFGEPNHENSNEDYAMFYYKFTDGTWNDGDFGGGTVNGGTAYICEWENAIQDKTTPAGYDFLEDSYHFENYGEKISKKYFTTLFGSDKGKLLYKEKKSAGEQGLCFGMAYTTASIYNELPNCNKISCLDGLSVKLCENIRDIDTYSAVVVNDKTIRIKDFIKYAFIYQFSSEVGESSSKTWNDIQGLESTVESYLENDIVGVTIGLTHGKLNKEGEWESDGGHRVLAVGIDGNDILIDDSNNSRELERLTINDDGSWSYSGAWISDGVNSDNSILRYQTDFYRPYQLLLTGKTTTVNEEFLKNDNAETYIEGMTTLDSDKLLLSVNADSYDIKADSYVEVCNDIDVDEELSNTTNSDLYWITEGDSVSIENVSGENNAIELSGNDKIIGAEFSSKASVQITSNDSTSKITASTIPNSTFTLTIDNVKNETDNTLAKLIGVTNSSGEIVANLNEENVCVSGLEDITVSYEDDEGNVLKTDEIKNGKDVDIKIEDNALLNHVHDFSNNAQYCKNGCGELNPDYVAPLPDEPTTEYPNDAPTTDPTTQPTTKPTTPVVTQPTTKPITPTTQAVVATTASTIASTTQATTEVKTVKKPKATSIKKLAKDKKSFKAKWKKISGVSGYEIQYSTDKKFRKSTKTTTIKKNTAKATIKKLASKKTYYVRVRSYKNAKIDGKKVKAYSNWSKVKSIKTK